MLAVQYNLPGIIKVIDNSVYNVIRMNESLNILCNFCPIKTDRVLVSCFITVAEKMQHLPLQLCHEGKGPWPSIQSQLLSRIWLTNWWTHTPIMPFYMEKNQLIQRAQRANVLLKYFPFNLLSFNYFLLVINISISISNWI